MKISELTYERVRQDLAAPPICTGPPDEHRGAEWCGWSANWHFHGINSGGQMHWSRGRVQRSGLHAFVRAYFQRYMNWQYVYEASVRADKYIQLQYGIQIPASASKWERRHVLAATRQLGVNLRTDYPNIYAWATYKGAK
jgi:hypothetical protein